MSHNHDDSVRLGIALRVLSGVLIAGMYVSVKLIGDRVPLGEIVFFRSFFAIIPLVIFLWLRSEFPSGLRTRRPMAHLLRSSFGVVALFTSFAALARLGVAEAVLLAQLVPILTTIAAVLLLSERLTRWRVLGLALGFSGVLMLVWPELDGSTLENVRLIGIALGLVSAAFSALSLIMVRSLSSTESPGAIALYFVLASMLAALFTLPSGWVVPNYMTLWPLVCTGLFGGFAHIAMTLSFKYAEASRLAPFEYIAIVWPILADLFILQQPLGFSFLLAAPLVILGAVVASMEGVRRKRKKV